MTDPATLLMDERNIRALVAGFVYRDQEKWEQLADIFWPDGRLALSWFSGTIDEFLVQSRGLAASGKVMLKHQIGRPRVQVHGDRAIGETDIIIMLRVRIGENSTLVDTTSWARFNDRYEKRDGKWKILLRTAIYEKDRVDPVEPGDTVQWTISEDVRNAFPHQYKRLASTMMELGRTQMPPAIVNASEDQDQLEQEAQLWLAGGA
ncbi:MAG: nuclear transport factor 2 family protein [Sphingobium sp.]|nr:nuclear transport factor 2 family protein [Sphingobium sp.]MCP5400076.1 nuclear transport factor 2 family protein [Sphingomonas sp.]